jgi:NAD(P)-dependent dehydrogenase (short-subunit alcohol dehydrogenase family)
MSTPTDAAAVVVGVGPGLGGALVATFADAGYTVFAAARRASKLGGLQRPDGRAIAVDCDATDPAEVERLFEQVEARGLPLAVAIYNAGVFAPGRVADIEPADFERCWRAGCFGGFLVGRAAARRMLPRAEPALRISRRRSSRSGPWPRAWHANWDRRASTSPT